MGMYSKIQENQMNALNENLNSLNKSIEEFSKSSNNLQEKLVFWTKIMAGAIIIQAIVIGVQVYLTIIK